VHPLNVQGETHESLRRCLSLEQRLQPSECILTESRSGHASLWAQIVVLLEMRFVDEAVDVVAAGATELIAPSQSIPGDVQSAMEA
jgi:hypothetical protein